METLGRPMKGIRRFIEWALSDFVGLKWRTRFTNRRSRSSRNSTRCRCRLFAAIQITVGCSLKTRELKDERYACRFGRDHRQRGSGVAYN